MKSLRQATTRPAVALAARPIPIRKSAAARLSGTCAAFLALAWGCEAPRQQNGEEPVDPQARIWAASVEITPTGPWPQGDQRGNANTQGPGTWMRCAFHMSKPDAKVYELSHERSMSMPQSPFSPPLEYVYRPTVGIPYTAHAFNGEHLAGGEPGAQGTQMDALGHFAWAMPAGWGGQPVSLRLSTLSAAELPLTGLASLQEDRFAHLTLDLRLPGETESGEAFRLNERRRLLMGEIHYFDHPRFGAIARLFRYRASPEPQTRN